MVSPRCATTLALLIATIAVTACTAVQPGSSATSDPSVDAGRPARSGAVVQPAPSRAPAVIEIPAAELDAILADAAERSGVDPAEIEVVQAESVVWPDGSLGCPEPGQTYTQALIDGYQVILEAGGESLDYRVGSGGSFRLCEQPRRPAES